MLFCKILAIIFMFEMIQAQIFKRSVDIKDEKFNPAQPPPPPPPPQILQNSDQLLENQLRYSNFLKENQNIQHQEVLSNREEDFESMNHQTNNFQAIYHDYDNYHRHQRNKIKTNKLYHCQDDIAFRVYEIEPVKQYINCNEKFLEIRYSYIDMNLKKKHSLGYLASGKDCIKMKQEYVNDICPKIKRFILIIFLKNVL